MASSGIPLFMNESRITLRPPREDTKIVKANKAPLHLVTVWTDGEGLNISPSKSTIIAFTRRQKLEGLGPLRLRNKEIQLSGEYMFNRDFEISIGDRGDLTEDHYSTLPGITWYTDGSKTEQGTGAGIYSGMRKIELSLPLGRYTSVFQAEVYALLQCARENNLRAYRNKRINILTDSQAALKGLWNHKVTSRLLWECWEELSDLARHNRVVLLWVPGHSGIKGNEKADELARKGSSASYIGPKPAVGVSKTMVRSQVKEWVNA
ncbi:hypothetical protein NQ315_015349 [Exocentrus adspersus]|uniref:ribonuclease H n=1 Tax=Exocentrus adspersus TaxID=1586481 RepID=A0AAV8VJT3_9CUCU|nr:hypothetical protein NQ315_015349 [Exocentrus adspersus]